MSDFEFLSLEFEFEGANYPALIRKKNKQFGVEYYITIMNGELEKLLFGNHIILETHGILEVDNKIHDLRQATLKLAIMRSLHQYLQSKKNSENGAISMAK